MRVPYFVRNPRPIAPQQADRYRLILNTNARTIRRGHLDLTRQLLPEMRLPKDPALSIVEAQL